jgi:hypothetical protein
MQRAVIRVRRRFGDEVGGLGRRSRILAQGPQHLRQIRTGAPVCRRQVQRSFEQGASGRQFAVAHLQEPQQAHRRHVQFVGAQPIAQGPHLLGGRGDLVHSCAQGAFQGVDLRMGAAIRGLRPGVAQAGGARRGGIRLLVAACQAQEFGELSPGGRVSGGAGGDIKQSLGGDLVEAHGGEGHRPLEQSCRRQRLRLRQRRLRRRERQRRRCETRGHGCMCRFPCHLCFPRGSETSNLDFAQTSAGLSRASLSGPSQGSKLRHCCSASRKMGRRTCSALGVDTARRVSQKRRQPSSNGRPQ